MAKRKRYAINPKKNWANLLKKADRDARARARRESSAFRKAFAGYKFYVGTAANSYLRGPKGRFAGRRKSK